VNSDGHRVGAEVLVRWQHTERDLLSPFAFIPVAEETDLIVDLGIWVMTESCRLIAQEEQVGAPLNLSVNISPKHFRQPEFVPWIKHLIATTGVDPSRLTFEITENLFINDIDDVVSKMIELNSLGFHFSIDDFGTGYSSLAYLKRLPIHELKIDKSFINDVPTDADDVALVETILAVAKHMRLKVVAEGVETEEQAAFLNARGQVIHQGYFFCRPEAAGDWIDRWHQHPHEPQSTSL
jgi:EAL domain-containing protein (putative c-di-GMP-specific phosphodiesterase class I)